MHAVRGRVYKLGRTWHYEVRVGDMVVFADNTRAWEPVLAGCIGDVFVARRVVGAGHTFVKSWPELVEEEM